MLILQSQEFKFNIPVLNGVLVEKYKEPDVENNGLYEWHDQDGNLHSNNGFPALIRIKSKDECQMLWAKHGKPLKSLIIDQEKDRDILVDKIKNRKFTKQCRKK